MKIALVCPYNMFNRPGGVSQVILHLYDGLKERGHEVKIITQRPSNFKGDPPEDFVLFGTTRTFKANGLGTEGNLGMPADGSEIAEYFKKERFDVINFHEPWIPWLAWQVSRNSKSVYVATFHANLIDTAAGKVWTSRIWTPIGRPFLEKMHMFTATSPTATGGLLSLANMKLPFDKFMIEHLRYIPCGVDLNQYKPVKKREPLNGPGTKTIVYIGRVEKRKGTDLLIKAFAELVKQMPEAHLMIGGAGLMLKKMKAYVEDEEINNVHFLGYVTEEEKKHLLGNADLACFPSPYGEGFGIVLLEAMAMGTPLLAGNNLGYKQVMKGVGRIGLIDPQATKDFANRMAIFLSDEQQRKLMVDWALSEVKQYDYSLIVKQYEDAYKEAIRLKDEVDKIPKKQKGNGKKSLQTIPRISVRRFSGQ